jgi:hypothetical protein
MIHNDWCPDLSLAEIRQKAIELALSIDWKQGKVELRERLGKQDVWETTYAHPEQNYYLSVKAAYYGAPGVLIEAVREKLEIFSVNVYPGASVYLHVSMTCSVDGELYMYLSAPIYVQHIREMEADHVDA